MDDFFYIPISIISLGVIWIVVLFIKHHQNKLVIERYRNERTGIMTNKEKSLTVGDGFRFGFGLTFGTFFAGMILIIISSIIFGTLARALLSNILY